MVDEEDEMWKDQTVTNSRGAQGQFPPSRKNILPTELHE